MVTFHNCDFLWFVFPILSLFWFLLFSCFLPFFLVPCFVGRLLVTLKNKRGHRKETCFYFGIKKYYSSFYLSLGFFLRFFFCFVLQSIIIYYFSLFVSVMSNRCHTGTVLFSETRLHPIVLCSLSTVLVSFDFVFLSSHHRYSFTSVMIFLLEIKNTFVWKRY